MVETINIFSCNSHMMLEVKIYLYEFRELEGKLADQTQQSKMVS
jgi:hypothetical protein